MQHHVHPRTKLMDPPKLDGKAHTTTINNKVRGRRDVVLSPLFARESRKEGWEKKICAYVYVSGQGILIRDDWAMNLCAGQH